MLGRSRAASPSAQVDYYAFVDGVLVCFAASLSGEDWPFAPGFESPIPTDARFLTLVASSDGQITGDWSGFLDPTLELVQPEPLTVGQIDTFDTGLDRWERGRHVTENGNGFLRIPGPEGSYIITFFTGPPWAGDYVAAGVTRLRISLRNEGPATLTLYVAFGTTSAPSQGGDWLATATPVTLAPGGGWTSYDVPIRAADLVSVQGSATYESVMANVQTLRILHNDHPDARALTVPLDTDLDIDNVEALPGAHGRHGARSGSAAAPRALPPAAIGEAARNMTRAAALLLLAFASAPLAAQAASFAANPTSDAFVTTGPTGNLSGNNYGGAGAVSVSAPN